MPRVPRLRSCSARKAPEADAGEGAMGSDVIISYDGKTRCSWAGAGDSPLSHYHDEVWGTRTDGESAMFEALTWVSSRSG